MKRFMIGLSFALISPLSFAATPHVATPDETLAIGYPTVAAARADLGRTDVKVFPQGGWIRVEALDPAVEWLFIPKEDPAYPSLIKLVGLVACPGQAGESVICGASAACATFIARERLNAQQRGKLFQAHSSPSI